MVMKNIVLLMEYDGTGYYGWQRQPGLKTIQGVLEKTLERIIGEEVTLFASGRTDKGVHARGQVANFRLTRDIELKTLFKALNSLLPKDIKIKEVRYADPSFHARFSAKEKIYYYYFSHFSHYTPFLRNYVWYIPRNFNVENMRILAKKFVGRHDFSSFRNLRGPWEKGASSIRNIFYSDILFLKNELYVYRISGDGFFYKMVRNIFGLIVQVGIGKLNLREAQEVFKTRDRKKAPPPVPPHGLFLVRVKY